MLQMCRIVIASLVFAHAFDVSAQQTDHPGHLKVKARIVSQKYCRGDKDLFTVWLKLDVEVYNLSERSADLEVPMVPWTGKIAANSNEAKSEHYLYELAPTQLSESLRPSQRLLVEPGKTAKLPIHYGLVARYDAKFNYPKSLPAGSYAVVLVLGPEMDQPRQTTKPRALDRLTTEPFVVTVSQYPKVIDCEESPGTKRHL